MGGLWREATSVTVYVKIVRIPPAVGQQWPEKAPDKRHNLKGKLIVIGLVAEEGRGMLWQLLLCVLCVLPYVAPGRCDAE